MTVALPAAVRLKRVFSSASSIVFPSQTYIMKSNDCPNFSVIRVKRDILKRSSIGAMVTNRSRSVSVPGSNQGYGLDAAFSFFDNVGLNAYWARTETPGVSSDDDSYQGLADYGGDRYGAHLEYLKVGNNFNPEVGFLRRTDFVRDYVQARFSPRPGTPKFEYW